MYNNIYIWSCPRVTVDFRMMPALVRMSMVTAAANGH